MHFFRIFHFNSAMDNLTILIDIINVSVCKIGNGDLPIVRLECWDLDAFKIIAEFKKSNFSSKPFQLGTVATKPLFTKSVSTTKPVYTANEEKCISACTICNLGCAHAGCTGFTHFLSTFCAICTNFST